MKSIFLVCCLFVLMAHNSYSQNITSKFLIGNWTQELKLDQNDSVSKYFPIISWIFIDSAKAQLATSVKAWNSADTINLNYTIDNTSALTLIYLEGKHLDIQTMEFYFLIKKINDDTIKVQGTSNIYIGKSNTPIKKPTFWDNNKNSDSTLTLIRKKGNL